MTELEKLDDLIAISNELGLQLNEDMQRQISALRKNLNEEEEDDRPRKPLAEAIRFLRELHENIVETQHALKERGKTYFPYEPTFFLYNFFAFNTIFSIDWKASEYAGELVESSKKEDKKINGLIDFCFSDASFSENFFPTFNRIVLLEGELKDEQIIKALEQIEPEGKRINEKQIPTFMGACKQVLTKDGFTAENMKTIYRLIYHVRCNIVHGTKSMPHMEEEGQRERIIIYTYFIIALLHMLFMRLACYDKRRYTPAMSESFLNRLKIGIVHAPFNDPVLELAAKSRKTADVRKEDLPRKKQ